MISLPFLYIDPGTGSAIFSILIGIAAAVYFTFQAMYIKIKSFFTGGRAKHGSKNKFVIYAEDKRYWTLFKPVVEEFESRGIDLLYLTASKDDPVFDAGFKHVKAECLGGGNKAFARLNFLSADFVLATTPGLDVYQWKRSKMVKHYSHLFHTPSEFAQCELFGMDYFDSLLVNGRDYQEEHIRKLEKVRNLPEKQIVTVGCSYLDEFVKKIEQIPAEENSIFTVLVSPSWSEVALLSRFGEKLLDPLVATGWRIIVRPHPQSLLVEKEIIDRLSSRYASNANLEWDFERDNIYSLKKADVMISDFSGIILDYMFLRNKPVFYVSEKLDWRSRDAFQIYEDQEEIWTFRNLKKTGIELKPDLLNDLPSQISKVSESNAMESAIKEVKTQAWQYPGEAGKRVANFMIETVEGLTVQNA
ncbi:MAG: CDP-glycerol glycerophosphotransferase family protein [Spirochaetes bacterium]|nr:CDP-glycerol glycerophosphotransferase family protein [Spirochaetota bacterium]